MLRHTLRKRPPTSLKTLLVATEASKALPVHFTVTFPTNTITTTAHATDAATNVYFRNQLSLALQWRRSSHTPVVPAPRTMSRELQRSWPQGAPNWNGYASSQPLITCTRHMDLPLIWLTNLHAPCPACWASWEMCMVFLSRSAPVSITRANIRTPRTSIWGRNAYCTASNNTPYCGTLRTCGADHRRSRRIPQPRRRHHAAVQPRILPPALVRIARQQHQQRTE